MKKRNINDNTKSHIHSENSEMRFNYFVLEEKKEENRNLKVWIVDALIGL